MAVQDRLYTTDDLLERATGEHRCELVRGAIIDMTPTVDEHGVIAGEIGYAIQHFRKQHNIPGYVTIEGAGFVLARNPDTVRAPDVGFILKARVPEGLQRRFFAAAPNLAVEVISEHERASEVQRKILDYLHAGTEVVWVVYPQTRTVVVHAPTGGTAPAGSTLGSDEVLTGEPVLPGFRLPVRDIFAVLER
jgi:Uma2 family endonuclease